ncbi:zinc finger protein 771-like isoform X1 [Acanthopagrus latus]|uniref:zinc finger protein 771-like isoform X1 n=2 Tax=Acanthopagrus latus TaxID=8177 RepID=UPI00187D0329|nr:zinc finger protein 771-like isoform X1 [Acanthopagrus latus]
MSHITRNTGNCYKWMKCWNFVCFPPDSFPVTQQSERNLAWLAAPGHRRRRNTGERTVNTAHIRVSRQFLTECFWRESSCESVKMSKVQTLRVVVKQRLTAAAEEIFELFERTIAEYEEELCRHRKLLDAVTEPQVQLHRTDVQQLLECKEEDPPEQQERSSSLDQEEPEPPHIKEEQEELWTRQEGEQLPGLEEADIKFTFTSVTVRSEEDDEEEPQSSQLHQRQTEQMETEADGEDCGGPELDKNSDPDRYLKPVTDDEVSRFSEPEINDNASEPEPETDDSSDWETRTPEVQSEERGSSCTVCKETFPSRSDVVKHMRTHKREKRFSCSVCGKTFSQSSHRNRHLIVHTGEKPFSCSLCGARFKQRSSLASHLKVHGGEKPHTCSVCKATFRFRRNLSAHMKSHSGEKPFSCSVCGQKFAERGSVRAHMSSHTGEKPYSCSLCGEKFARPGTLRRHSIIHTREKHYSCSVCNKSFTRLYTIKIHKCVDESSQNA